MHSELFNQLRLSFQIQCNDHLHAMSVDEPITLKHKENGDYQRHTEDYFQQRGENLNIKHKQE